MNGSPPDKIFDACRRAFNRMVARPALALGAIFLLTILAFSNIFRNTFLLDDWQYIVNWPLIRDFHNLPRFFVGYIAPDGQVGIYSPLKTFFHAVNYHLWGLNTAGYHLTSILIHFAGIIAVYRLTQLLLKNRSISFLTALLFALHPVHVESVTSMTGSVDTIGIVAMLFSFYYYVRAVGEGGLFTGEETGPVPGMGVADRRSYRASFLLAVLAIFTHELTIVLPVLFWFYDIAFSARRRSFKGALARTGPFFVLALFYVFCKWAVLGGITRGHYLFGSAYLSQMTEIKALARYLVVLVFPRVLTHDPALAPGIPAFSQDDFNTYAALSQSLFDPLTLVSFIAVVTVIAWGATSYRRFPLGAFCTGWFFISLLPVMQIIPSAVFYAERYLYAGSWAYCMLLSYGIVRLYARPGRWAKGAAVTVVLVFTVFYGVRTFLRNADLRNGMTAFKKAVADNPTSGYLENDLGIIYLQNGYPRKAVKAFKKAIAINPANAHFYLSAEGAYSVLGRYADSVRVLTKAIELQPDMAEAYYNRAGVYAQLNEFGKARDDLNRAIGLYRRQGRILEAGEDGLRMAYYIQHRESEEERAAGQKEGGGP